MTTQHTETETDEPITTTLTPDEWATVSNVAYRRAETTPADPVDCLDAVIGEWAVAAAAGDDLTRDVRADPGAWDLVIDGHPVNVWVWDGLDSPTLVIPRAERPKARYYVLTTRRGARVAIMGIADADALPAEKYVDGVDVRVPAADLDPFPWGGR